MEKERHLTSYSQQHIENDDIEIVLKALNEDLLTGGKYVELFEKKLAKTIGVERAISCSNCTAALHLASLAAGVSAGDFVIVPTVTFASTANVPRLLGAEIIFADVDPLSGLINRDTFLAAVERAPKIPKILYYVHLSGQSAGAQQVYEAANSLGINVIDDAAHALGGKISGEYVGSIDTVLASCFSFHPVKPITTGEGGAVTSSSSGFTEKVTQLRSHGIERNHEHFANKDLGFNEQKLANQWYYEIHQLGLNYRLPDINCALGLSQLFKLEKFTKKRQKLAAHYNKKLSTLSEFIRPIKRGTLEDDAFHLYPILINFDKLLIDKNSLMNQLKEMKVGSQVHYIPLHLQPYYIKRYGKLKLKGALEYYNAVISIPLHFKMELKDVDYVAECLGTIISNSAKT